MDKQVQSKSIVTKESKKYKMKNKRKFVAWAAKPKKIKLIDVKANKEEVNTPINLFKTFEKIR